MLHTWGRNITAYHPHVHFVVPGGGISPDGSKWMQVKPDKLFHPLPAKQLFKKRFVLAIRKAGLYHKLPYGVLKFDWVVNVKPVGDGGAVLKYLAPYVYRVAISDNRIVSVDDTEVRYRVKPSGERRYQPRRLDGETFVRCFAQHILPPGFRKVRYYGFMSHNSKVQLTDARWLAWLWRGWTYWLGSAMLRREPVKRRVPKCSRCGSELELEGVSDADGRWLYRRTSSVRGPPRLPRQADRSYVKSMYDSFK
ncbi:MAG: transposase [Planctomycetota bacterium]